MMHVESLHETQEAVHKEDVGNNQLMWARVQQIHDAQTRILQINIDIGQYVLIWVQEKKSHKLRTKWEGPMPVAETEYNIVYIVVDV